VKRADLPGEWEVKGADLPAERGVKRADLPGERGGDGQGPDSRQGIIP
jgi:hypothetical protein